MDPDSPPQEQSLGVPPLDSMAAELHRFLEKKLPEYMLPSGYIPLGSLPLTANGKVERWKLPQPELLDSQSPVVNSPPQSELELVLATIIKKMLQLESVGIKSNFFDLGATSVHIIQIHGQIKDKLGVDVPIVKIFQYPTIAFLSKYLSGEGLEKTFAHEIDEQTEKQKQLRNRQSKLRAKRKSKL